MAPLPIISLTSEIPGIMALNPKVMSIEATSRGIWEVQASEITLYSGLTRTKSKQQHPSVGFLHAFNMIQQEPHEPRECGLQE